MSRPINFEIERKWLVLDLPPVIDLGTCKSEGILQGYFTDNEGKIIRLRQKGSKWYRTHKTSTDDPMMRVEDEVEISEEEFLSSWPQTQSRRLEKTRYYVPLDKFTVELDVFLGDNNGCMMAEVEFENVEAAKAFTPPSWFGPEVTEDMRYTNSDIAEHGFPKTA